MARRPLPAIKAPRQPRSLGLSGWQLLGLAWSVARSRWMLAASSSSPSSSEVRLSLPCRLGLRACPPNPSPDPTSIPPFPRTKQEPASSALKCARATRAALACGGPRPFAKGGQGRGCIRARRRNPPASGVGHAACGWPWPPIRGRLRLWEQTCGAWARAAGGLWRRCVGRSRPP